MTIKLNKQTRKTCATAKRYGAVFACLTTWAVHLELIGNFTLNFTTDNFTLGLRRYISGRGYPLEIFSDNETNFIGGVRELHETISELDQNKIYKELAAKRIKWNFSPPASPKMNEAMEAVVKITKIALKTVVRDSLFTAEMLATYLTEIESLINGRPLIPISDDVKVMEALTPNHFLLGGSNLNVNISISQDNVSKFRTKWKSIQDMLSVFWKRWIAEYLPLLVQRKKWNLNTRNSRVDDLVGIADENLSRANWPLGRIIEIFPGSDKVIRVAKMKTSQGVYVRPTANLCLLEGTD